MADPPASVLKVISHYRIIRKLGEGGMGVVYRAHDEHLQRDVALKVLPVTSLTDPKARARLRREAQTAAALNHPNICAVYEVAEADGVLYIAMEFVNGRTLKDIAVYGLAPDLWIRYASQISEALAHAHNLGILHRDLKSSNVMISSDGRAKVVDFGLAKHFHENDLDVTKSSLTADRPGSFIGTLAYAAPEVLRGQSPDSRSDVWSLGVLLFEGLTGALPFRGHTAYEITSAILRAEPEPIPPLASPAAREVIQRCLRKLPEERFQHAGEVESAFHAAASSPRHGTPTQPANRKSHWLGHTHLTYAILGLAVLAVVAISLFIRSTLHRTAIPPRQGQLVVLPVNTMETDPAMTAFGRGLAETLTARLTQLTEKHAIQVIPASAVQAKSIASVGQARKEFGANLGLELNFHRSTDQIRVNFSLVDAQSLLQIAAGTVTGKSTDTFDVEDQVCEAVANALEIKLQPSEKNAFLRSNTAQPNAYDFYVQGRGYLKSFNHPEGLDSAISVFNHALELDQNYAPAFAGLGLAYWNKYELTKDRKWLTQAKSACQHAVQLSSTLPQGHACLGSVLNTTGLYEQAVDQFQEAVRLDPTDDSPYIGLATSYEKLGKTQDAERTYQRAIQLRPSYPLAYNRLGEFQMAHGQYQDAAGMFKQVIALAPDNFAGYSNLGDAYLLLSRYTEAVPMFERSIALRRTAETLSNLGTAYFQLRRFPDAARIYEEAVQADEHNYEVWGNLADAYYWSPELRPKASAAYEKASSLALKTLKVNPRDVNALGYLAEYQAMLGRRKEALAYLDRSLRPNTQDPALLFNAALVYHQLGEDHTALSWLEKATAAGLPKSNLLDSPNFDNLHGNSRFVRLAK
jgi:tetratricopeptide (TPR) repeat protein/predicted Ser/Thr protein kinase